MSGAGVPRRAFLGTALGAALAAACGRRPAAAARSLPIRYPIPNDPFPLDFARARDTWGLTISQLVGEPLVRLDRKLDVVPRVARGWEWSPDHLSLTFRLRPDVLWHDGRAVTADDVVHTWRTVIDPERAIPDRAYYFNLVEDLTAPDPLTVQVRYSRPFAPALLAWTTAPLVPRHVSARGDRPLGCGPWTVTDWIRGERIALRPFERYFDGPPLAPGLQFDVLPEFKTQLAALRAGQVDVGPLIPDHYREVAGDAEFHRRFEVLEYRVLFFLYVAWRIDSPNGLFREPQVRLALTHAIDRAGYLERIAQGFGRVATTSFHPDLWGHDPTLSPWPYDPARARALLAAAGFQPGPDGVLTRAGRPFRFALSFYSVAENRRIAEFVQGGLRAVGVDAQLDPLEWSVFQDRTRKRAFDAMLGGRKMDADPDPYDLWHSSQAATGANYPGLRDPEIDRWIERARESFDRAERASLYGQIGRRLHDLQPDTFFLHPNSRVAVARGLGGVVASSMGLFNFWPGVHAWHRTG